MSTTPETPPCPRCLYIRAHILAIFVVLIIGLLAGENLDFLTAITPLRAAIYIIAISACLAMVKHILVYVASRT